ncbi:putative metal-binding motif-containing protein [Myxococcota bacterium]|nr:putative metal-binding motif-containing protein [Myxococcota bacterium]
MRATACLTVLLALITACGDKEDATNTPTEDTDAAAPTDADGDGAAAELDCDDEDPSVFPGAAELCDGRDNNCDGSADEGVLESFFADADADGYGDANAPLLACAAPEGAAENDQDCDDADPTTHPGAGETCDTRDNDCDGKTDEGVLQTFYADEDGDGYGDAAVLACALTEGLAETRGDCDDNSSARAPNAVEICDELDNDCDGIADELVESPFYRDVDHDGHGDADDTTWACAAPEGYVAVADDCDDSDALSSPSAAERCDSKDNDCDGVTDEGTQITVYADLDGDGHGDPDSSSSACAVSAGWAATPTDCDDDEATISPDGTEACTDGVDNDCDGAMDEGALSLYYLDLDEDGHGGDSTVLDCALLDGYTTTVTDCDDADEDISPDARETCRDTLDNDCDDEVDESDCTQPIPTSFVGTATFEYGFTPKRGARECDLVFDTTAVTASTRRSCATCEWALEFTLAYDTASSVDRGGCHDGSDLEWILGYEEDYYGYGTMMYYGYGSWYPIWEASWDDSTGQLTVGAGYLDYPYAYRSKTYYYTNYWTLNGTTY